MGLFNNKKSIVTADGSYESIRFMFREELASVIRNEITPLRELVSAVCIQMEEFIDEVSQLGGHDLALKMGELTKSLEANSSQSVVRKIDISKQVAEKQEAFDSIITDMNMAYIKFVKSGKSLINELVDSRHPTLSKEGQTLYNTISKSIVKLAKVCGESREKYTNFSTMYKPFFRSAGIKRLEKATVNFPDAKATKSVQAAIIICGMSDDFVRFVIRLIEREAERHIAELQSA
jgi:hypothetical protein